MMRHATGACALGVLCALSLSGCGGGDTLESDHPLAGTSWEVVAVYQDPDVPGDVPFDAAGRARLAFGGSSVSANTGCAPLQAVATVKQDSIKLEEVKQGRLHNPCIGGTRRVHDQLTGILTTGAEFSLTRYGDREMTLRLRSDELDPPTIRLVQP